jgi:hypothetical protein
MSLTELTIRAAKPTQKPYKVFDEKGLFLLLKPNGARLWRFKYTHNGVEKLLSLGAYPDVPLRLARIRRDEARRLVVDHIDPSAKRRSPRARARSPPWRTEWLPSDRRTSGAMKDRSRLLESHAGLV